MRTERGFTLIEMVVVVIMIGVVAAIAIPRALRTTTRQQVDRTARQVTRDLELVRMRAISAKRLVRMKFEETDDFYTAFMDTTDTRDGTIAEVLSEMRLSGIVARGGLNGIPGVELPRRITFGCGNASAGPLSFACAGTPVSLGGLDYAEFDTRGMLTPLGSTGAIYLVHEDDPDAVAVVTLSGGGSFRYWRYRDGTWVK